MGSRGIIYLVSGPKSYLGELRTSVLSLRRHEPDLAVTVFSDRPLPRDLRVEHVEHVSELHPLQQKVDVLARSPYDETLFLDTDTTVLGPIHSVFDALATHNFAVAHASVGDYSVRPPRLIELTSPNEYNTGVLCFDSSYASHSFLEAWKEAVLAQDPTDMWPGHHCDQTYFNALMADDAMAAHGVEFTSLDNTVYNVRGIMIDEMKRQGIWSRARILHHRTLAMKLRKLAYSLTDTGSIRDTVRRGSVAAGQKLDHALHR